MMPLIVNLPAPVNPPLPAIEVTVTLDGENYTLSLQWNETPELWFMDVLDSLGQTVIMGDQALIADWPLYASRVRDLRRPPGYFLVRDTASLGENPTLAGLGARWQLEYIPGAEVTAAGIT